LDLSYNGTGRLRYGSYGTDSPHALVREVLRAAASHAAAPDAVLVAGDLVRHGTLSLDETLATYDAVYDDIRASFPSSLVCGVLGNDDVFPGYFFHSSVPDYYARQAAATGRDCHLGLDESTRLARFGYYSRLLWPGVRLLSLNTLVYSVYSRVPAEDDRDPLGQLEWLQAQLQESGDRGEVCK
jgi:3',5'-cyclic AMP phosphodiesterase CpdA